MKRIQMKRSGVGAAKMKNLKKPFDFCCDINHQDPKTQYNMRIPPFESSLTKIPANKDGPDLKFRIQDIGKPTYPILRSGSHKMRSALNMGRSKRGHGPLRWYIEEEVALAREIIAKEKEIKYKQERKKARMDRKRAKSKRRNKKRKNLVNITKEKDSDAERESSDKDDDDKK